MQTFVWWRRARIDLQLKFILDQDPLWDQNVFTEKIKKWEEVW